MCPHAERTVACGLRCDPSLLPWSPWVVSGLEASGHRGEFLLFLVKAHLDLDSSWATGSRGIAALAFEQE